MPLLTCLTVVRGATALSKDRTTVVFGEWVTLTISPMLILEHGTASLIASDKACKMWIHKCTYRVTHLVANLGWVDLV